MSCATALAGHRLAVVVLWMTAVSRAQPSTAYHTACTFQISRSATASQPIVSASVSCNGSSPVALTVSPVLVSLIPTFTGTFTSSSQAEVDLKKLTSVLEQLSQSGSDVQA